MKEHFCPAEKSIITYQGKCNWCGESEGSMNEIIEMAREAGFFIIANSPDLFSKLVAFANLVAANEREACAKLIDPSEEHRKDASWGYIGGNEGVEMLDALAAAIRARGQA